MSNEPIVGEVRNGKELGYKNHHRMVWALCPICKKPRWTRLSRQHKPCLGCAIHLSKGVLALTEYPPGRVKKAQDVGIKGHGYVVLRTCSDCKREDWIVYQGIRTPKRCHRCAAIRNWTPGKSVKNAEGYIKINIHPNDFFAHMAVHGYILEHRLIMAKSIGRCLLPWEIVHHKNGIKHDNRRENLQIELVNNHNQITILERKIKKLQAENRFLKSIR